MSQATTKMASAELWRRPECIPARAPWPGKAVILAKGERITADLLPFWRGEAPAPCQSEVTSLEQVERDHIERMLRRTGDHKSRTAQLLGVCRRTLDRKMAEYNLAAPGFHQAYP